MKILILTSSFPQNDNSYEGGFIFELGKKLLCKGFSPQVLAPHFPGGKKHEILSGIPVSRIPYFYPYRYEKLAYGSGILFNLKKYPYALFLVIPFIVAEFVGTIRIITKNNISLIHTHWLIPQGFIGALMQCFFHIPHVATVHGSDLTILKKHRLLHPLCHFIVRNKDIITVNSTYMKKLLLSLVPDLEQKVRVIPMGIEAEKFKTGKFFDLKKQYKTDHLILSVGRLVDLKGIIHLIDAMPDVLLKYPDTTLLIIGDGPEKDFLNLRIQALGIVKNVKMLGRINPINLFPYYQSSDIFVLPSININGKTEALGVVLLEAMASGCPVIGSNVGGIPDIIDDGENGFLVPEQRPDVLAEKIVQLLSDDELKEKFRKNGYTKIQHFFTWDIIAMEFSNVYAMVFTDHKNNG
jgi:N-acetyl-alpha-D-glucosaminyl L-malate synthase BshA